MSVYKYFLTFILITGLGLACSSSSKNDSADRTAGGDTSKSTDAKATNTSTTSRRLTYVIHALTRGQVKAGSSFALTDNTDEDLKKVERANMLKKALVLEGFIEAQDTDKADFTVTTEVEMEKPFAGVTLGIINPYKHTLRVRARHGKQLMWQVEVKGPSEYSDLERIFPQLLAVSHAYFGKTTNGEAQVQMADQDDRVTALLEAKTTTTK